MIGSVKWIHLLFVSGLVSASLNPVRALSALEKAQQKAASRRGGTPVASASAPSALQKAQGKAAERRGSVEGPAVVGSSSFGSGGPPPPPPFSSYSGGGAPPPPPPPPPGGFGSTGGSEQSHVNSQQKQDILNYLNGLGKTADEAQKEGVIRGILGSSATPAESKKFLKNLRASKELKVKKYLESLPTGTGHSQKIQYIQDNLWFNDSEARKWFINLQSGKQADEIQARLWLRGVGASATTQEQKDYLMKTFKVNDVIADEWIRRSLSSSSGSGASPHPQEKQAMEWLEKNGASKSEQEKKHYLMKTFGVKVDVILGWIKKSESMRQNAQNPLNQINARGWVNGDGAGLSVEEQREHLMKTFDISETTASKWITEAHHRKKTTP